MIYYKVLTRLDIIPLAQRYCIYCKSNQTCIDSNGYNKWYKIDNNLYSCHRCYMKHYFKKCLSYKGNQIYIKEKNLIGKCSICKKRIGDPYINKKGKIATIKRTNTHHIKYHDHDMLKDTTEICVSCHNKLTWIERKKYNKNFPKIKIPMNKRNCSFCNSKKTYFSIGKNCECWYNVDNKLSCQKCYQKHYRLKRKNKEKKLLSS